MQLEHEFRVPVPVATAWDVLLDVQRIAPCMPGAQVTEVRGDEFDGRVKVKLGPMQITYAGTARFAKVDESARNVVIEASGKEARGSGTARATITTQMREDGDSTVVAVVTDLAITGRPAQFGRGVMAEVGAKLVGQFADCVAHELAASPAAPVAAVATEPEAMAGADTAPTTEAAPAGTVAGSTGAPAAAAAGRVGGTQADATAGAAGGSAAAAPGPAGRTAEHRPHHHRIEAIDLLETAGLPVLKRLGPPLAALVALLAVVFLVRRVRR